MEVIADRSMEFHKAYFAQIHEAFKNLDEQYDGKFPDSEYLRKWALVECGYYTESTFAMDTPKDARALGIAIRKRDRYAIITIKGSVVKVFDPLSQSVPHMDAVAFKESAQAVLDLISGMARTTPAELKKNAGRSA
ncbi:hypothetical protein [Bradyrhizobium sp.]